MSRRTLGLLITIALTAGTVIGFPSKPGGAQGADPQGILELATSTDTRPLLTATDLQALLPERGQFTFPAPYNTTGVRLTNQHDCAEWYDCVNTPVGSSWRNMNNSAGSNFLYIVLGLDRTNGGVGPALFRYDKTTGETASLGGLFDADDDRTWGSLDGWYFSPSLPTKFYIGLDQQLSRYDILTHQTSVVFDTTAQFGDDKEVYHAQSSNDDRVHSFTLRLIQNYQPLGCGVYREDTQQFSYFPAVGALHECQIDKSGQWLLIKEDRDTSDGEDNRIVNLYTGVETVLLRTAGAAGSSDNGFGMMVAVDATAGVPNGIRTWAFGPPLAEGPIVSHSLAGLPPSFTQISFANARSAALDQQYACGGVANRDNGPRANEIACVRLDGSLTTLTIAPTMTDLDALGGGPPGDDGADLIKQPFGNLDPTGQFFLWTTNLLGDRIDAFLVKVPSARLVTVPSDSTAPAVAITAPADTATVNGTTVSLTASASDNVGVTGVQYQLDGANLGTEITTAPFSWTWNTTTAPDGAHVLTAIARDAAGNFTLSLPIAVTVLNTPSAPQISGVTVTGVIERLATVRWMTNQLADSLVEYGTTTTYGSATTLNPALTAAHFQTLTGLTAGTTYHYRVTSKNKQGVAATSGDFVFTTRSAPQISGVVVSALTPTSALISWTTDLPADALVEYGTTPAYGDAINTSDTFLTSHAQGLYNLEPGTTYHFRVQSSTPESVVSVSNDFTFVTVGAPVLSGIGASPITLTTATIAWTTDQASNTEVEYGLTAGYGSSTGADGAYVTAHSPTLTGLAPATIYHYRVRSQNQYGLLATSGDLTFTTLGGPVISSVTASSITGTMATIAWNTDQAATSQVDYGTTTGYGATALEASLVSTHGQTLAGLTAGATYHYRVTAINAGGQASMSGDFTFTTVAPPVISGVGPSGVTNSTATIGWTTDQAASSQIEYGLTTAYGTTTTLDSTLVTTHSQLVSGLTPATTYHYRVISTNSVGLTTLSTDAIVTAVAAPVISGVNVSAITAVSATINWGTDQPANSRIEYGLTSAYGSSTTLDTALVMSHSQTPAGLASGTTYHYRVLSANNLGLLGTSADATFTTVGGPNISSVLASALTGTAATITWTTDQPADSQVEYGLTTAYGSTTTLNASLVTSHSQNLAGLTNGTAYHYRVRSTNGAGGLTTSPDATFTTIALPVISAVSAVPLDISATITWTTAPAADTLVQYGLTTAYGSTTVVNATLVTSHSQNLAGLTANTTYHYRVLSANAAGQAASGDFTFATLTNPVISGLNASAITGTSATINWTTNHAANSQVDYGLTTAYGTTTALNAAMVTAHSQILPGLTAGTLYHFRVRSTNLANLLTVSGDFTFVTAMPPVISNVNAAGITGTTATITWTTDQTASSQVDYGLTTAYGSTTTLDPALVTSHSQNLAGLTSGATWHYRVRSTSAAGVLAISTDRTLTTLVVRSVLVVSPHPDDDVLIAAGVVAAAVNQGASVRIAYVTNGDACCAPFGVPLGLQREAEAVSGQLVLGVPESNLLFLGYPDGSLATIAATFPNANQVLTTSWGQSTTYANRGFGNIDWHTSKFGAPANYNGANILQDLTSILQTYRPDDIYTTAGFDQHADHSTTYTFVAQAMAQAAAADATYRPILHKSIVHAVIGTPWPDATGPQTPFTEPPGLAGTGVTWAGREGVAVPAALQNPNLAVNPKAIAIATHSSQGGTAGFLGQFLHSDEFFWTETSVNPTPVLLVTPSPFAFGSRAVGTSTPQTFVIANTGTAPLTITIPQLPIAPFAATNVPANGTVIAAGNSVTITVTFAPTTLTSSTDVLAIQSNGGNAAVLLTGTGTAPAGGYLSVTPGSIAFSNTVIGGTSSRTVTIANLGGTALTISTITAPSAPFGATGLPANGTVVAPGASLTATVTFGPASAAPFTGSLVVQSTGGNATATLAGTGVVGTAVPSPLAGGWQLNGNAAIVAPSLRLTDNVTAFAVGSAFWPTPVLSANMTIDFDATITGGNGADGMTLALMDPAAGATALGTAGGALGFSPLAGVAVTFDTYQNGNDPSSNFVGIATGWTGTVDTLVYAATSTTVPNLRSGPHHVTVTTGGGRIKVKIDDTLYIDQIVTLPGTVLVGFTGANGGLVDEHSVANVNISAAAAGPAPLATATPNPIDFAHITLNTTASRTVTITNLGNAPMTIGTITAPLAPFGATGLPAAGTVVAAGASVNATVTFTPTVNGAFNDALVVQTDGGTVSVALRGGLTQVLGVTSSVANATYVVGNVIPIAVTFNAPVTVTGTPRLTLETGTTDALVNYSSGTGTATLTFNYTVAAGHVSADLDYLSTAALALNGGTIRDSLLTAATLTLPAPGAAGSLGANKNIVVDTVLPTVTNVASPLVNGAYAAGVVIPVVVTFSEPVNVTGTPQLTLALTPAAVPVNYVSGSGTASLTFNYTVAAGQASADLNYAATTSLTLNAGTIKDLAGNNATLTLPGLAAAGSLGTNMNIVVDAVAATVTSVTSSAANGTYVPGAVIPIQVVFNEIVTVTGVPQLQLNTGGLPNAVVSYTSGSGTNTLVFNYTVAQTDTSADLDYTDTLALTLNAGTIVDVAANPATLTLPAPAAAGSLGANKNIVITGFAKVINVTSSTANGTFITGGVISIQVVFDKTVTVTGTPRLTLATVPNAVVNYTSGSGTATLNFNYTVAAGQNSADLDYLSTTALALNGGTIRDALLNAALLALPTPGAAGSLGANKSLVVDTAVPTVLGVTSSVANGPYGVGSVIPIQVTFTEPVNVTGTPTLTLAATPNTAVAYASGTGTATLTFNYTVIAGNASADLNYVATTSLALAGGTVKDLGGNNATLTLPALAAAGSLGTNQNIVIETIAPTVTNVTSSAANGTYIVGSVVPIQVVFSEPVNVTGTPTLTLALTPAPVAVNYTSGSGTNTLTFSYTVAAGQTAADLNYAATTSLAGSITDLAGNIAPLTLPALAGAGSLATNKNIVVSGIVATVTNVTSSTADGTYGAGASISIQVTFSQAVTVTGSPRLLLETGATDTNATYASGTGTTTLTFTYVVVSGNASLDLNSQDVTALTLNGGTIKSANGNNADLTVAVTGAGALSTNKALVVDAAGPVVTNVTSSTADGSYGTGAVISIQVTFNEIAVVTGTPRLTLATGTNAVVNYTSGTGTTTLTFNYTVAAGQSSADLDYLSTTALALNAGTIRDALANNAVLTLPAPGAAGSLGANKNIVIDNAVPTVANVSSPTANGTYGVGTVIPIEVTFSEPVVVTGTPTLTLAATPNTAVSYASGSGTATLTFNYTVAAGNASADLNYAATTSLALAGGTIKDLVGNNATLTLPALAGAGSLATNKALVINTVAPTVTGVTSSTANGTYGTGVVIPITVTFSKAVTVTGTPQLTLAATPDTAINYTSGSGTTTLTFTYTVATGNSSADLNYASTTALALNGGTIKDVGGNNATLTLPGLAAAGSLATNKALVINAVPATVTNVTSSTANGTYVAGAVISIQVTFNKAVTVTGIPQLTLATGNNAVVSYASGSGTATLTFTYTVSAGQTSADLDYASTTALALNGGTIKDTLANPATLTLPAPGAAGSLGANKAIVINAPGPEAFGLELLEVLEVLVDKNWEVLE